MSVRVANIRKLHRVPDETRVYIGRKGQGYDESPLANPFRSRDLPGGKAEAISLYRSWLRERLAEDSVQAREILRLAREVASGKNIVLMCWCHPSPCHGDVLVSILETVVSRMRRVP